MQGGVFQMVAHGVITGALFLLVGVIYERTHDRTIAKMGGLGQTRARLRHADGLLQPGLGGPARPGRLRGRVPGAAGRGDASQPWVGYVAAFTIIFAAVYLLYMVQNIIMGDVTDFLKGLGNKLTDVSPMEAATLAPLVVLTVRFGLFPALVLDLIALPVDGVLADRERVRLRRPLRPRAPGCCHERRGAADAAAFIIVVGLALAIILVDLFLPTTRRRHHGHRRRRAGGGAWSGPSPSVPCPGTSACFDASGVDRRPGALHA